MATTPPAVSPAASAPALWIIPEEQPFLEQSAIDDKHEPDNASVDLGPTPRGLGPIQLTPDDIEQGTISAPSRRFWKFRFCNVLEDVPAEHRSVLRDMGKGVLYIVTTPIGLVAVTLYACGVVIEGIALLLKGVGSLGGSFLMRRRNRRPESPSPETWVEV